MGKIKPTGRGLVDLSHESHKFGDFKKLSLILVVAGDPENATARADINHRVVRFGPQIADKSVNEQIVHLQPRDLVLDDGVVEVSPFDWVGYIFGVGESGYNGVIHGL